MNQSAIKPPVPEHVDVLILGAGVSGIGAAYEMSRQSSSRTWAVLEAFDSFGGTWLAHRYPGVRSDSDLFTYGFRFKPWTGSPIASGDQILSYLEEAIDENGLGPHFHYGCKILAADWDSATSVWRIEGVQGAELTPFQMTCGFLWMCQGYYRHGRGYTPEWPSMADFRGQIVHPQTWPKGLEYAGKRVIVIGSGATAATLVPALAAECGHVTMLQRSPTYFSPAPNRHLLADELRKAGEDPATIHKLVRERVVFDQHAMLQRALEDPDRTKSDMLEVVAAYLPREVVQAHFTPTYRPWQQRVALVPDGDLFKALGSGKASIVTDEIETFTPTGVRLKSGLHLDAEIIVTATGFEMSYFGDIDMRVDGDPVDLSSTVSYRGIMLTGVPNMARTMGYFRVSSWTLRVHLVADLVCRMLDHMRAIGASRVEVQLRPQDEVQAEPRSSDVFNAGYVLRAAGLMPRGGPAPEWAIQDHWWEKDSLPEVELDHDVFTYRDPAGLPIARRRVEV